MQTGSVDFTAGSYFVEVYGAPPLRNHLFALAREIYAKLG
jgi:hypothetical protein